MPYAPDSRYVDLYVNGFYWGAYLLCERIEPDSLLPKVRVSDYLEDDDTLKEDFSFVVEVNPSAGDDDNWFSTNDIKVTIKSPKLDPGDAGYDEVREYVKKKFDRFYAATAPSGDLAGTADIDSVAKLYLINELGKNWDSGAASTFFTYQQDENGVYKFYGSPVWDYDNSMGNATGVKDDLRITGITDYEEYKEEVLFQINWRDDITTTHVVRYDGVLYDITRIDDYEGRKEDLKLYCARRARQNG